ncbi:MAG: hypothetical protein IPM98_03535 [Lewinellaceae bacterium]|nr:hypothetical protein [Lewinellaceae bacterium]
MHDSTDDSVLQIDDISIVQDKSSRVTTPGTRELYLRVLPNPVSDFANLSWELPAARDGRIVVSDILGKTSRRNRPFRIPRLNLVLPAGFPLGFARIRRSANGTLRTPAGPTKHPVGETVNELCNHVTWAGLDLQQVKRPGLRSFAAGFTHRSHPNVI